MCCYRNPVAGRIVNRPGVQLWVPGVGVPGSDAGIVARSTTSIRGQLFPALTNDGASEFERAGV